MKKSILSGAFTTQLLPYLFLLNLFISVSAIATPKADISANSQAKIVSISNPSKSYGVQIGDKLTRKIVLSVPAAYQIVNFPKKGSKNKGVELTAIAIETNLEKARTLYVVNLSYQAFVNPNTPSILQLPAERFELKSGLKPIILGLPAWHFWFAPIATGGIELAQKNMQPEIKPPLIDIAGHQARLIFFLSVLITSLLGLLYINADARWLPFMGGAFAKAHRQLKRLSKKSAVKTKKDEKLALVYLHQAFNQHYGANIFARDIEYFVATRPSFRKIKADIEQFFYLSNQSLYVIHAQDSNKVIANLMQLSKQLRDCERGI